MAATNSESIGATARRRGCDCNWGDDCREFQQILAAAKNPSAGLVRIRVPKGADKENPRKDVHSKLHFIKRVKKLCGITRDFEPGDEIYIARHHWRPTVHEAARISETPLSSTYSFKSKADWEIVNKLSDPLDIYNSPPPKKTLDQRQKAEANSRLSPLPSNPRRTVPGAPKKKPPSEGGYCVFLTPNQTKAEVVAYTSPLTNVNAEAKQSRRENQEIKKKRSRRVEDWEADMDELKSQNKKLKLENEQLQCQLKAKQQSINELGDAQRERELETTTLKGDLRKTEKKCARLEESRDSSLRHLKEENKQLRTEFQSCKSQGVQMTIDDLVGFAVSVGGLSRLTIFNDRFHAEHKDAARLFYGFDTWNETKEYVKQFFPELKDLERSCVTHYNAATKMVKFSPITEFEKCLLTKLAFRVRLNKQRLNQIIEG